MTLRKFSSGGRYEEAGSYVRAKRVGPFVYVAGTTAVEADGSVHAPGDTYRQSVFIFAKIAHALEQVGSEMRHVVRTRAYVTDMAAAGDFVRAHGEAFKGIEPVLTGVQAGLSRPGMMVEVDVDAIVHDEAGTIPPQ